ncbi:MAG: electron transfer flavoprotein subunit alpha/FixB family protein [Schleiferiaceae bacterium]
MSVLVFAESWDGAFKKATFEAVGYAAHIAQQKGTSTTAVVLGSLTDDASTLGQYGANKVIHAEGVSSVNGKVYAETLAAIAEAEGADTVIISGSFTGKTVAPIAAVKMGAALITNAVELPSSVSPMTVKRGSFSSKAFATYQSNADKVIISITPNSVGVGAPTGGSAAVESGSVSGSADTTQQSLDKAQGKIPLPEAELVVSAGRGLKGPENWGMVEDLAELLGAGTACSKPVSDIGWRPHTEHVGQTGIAIRPNLYIAIGISGAIQHLAGVSNSKTIVVINNDPEAPFFKAADYGIVGDAFDVVPKLTEAIRQLKANN